MSEVETSVRLWAMKNIKSGLIPLWGLSHSHDGAWERYCENSRSRGWDDSDWECVKVLLTERDQ